MANLQDHRTENTQNLHIDRPLQNKLEESTKESGHSQRGNVNDVGNGSRVAGSGGSAAAGTGGGARGARRSIVGARVCSLVVALELATNDAVIVKLAERSTREVASALDVEGTLDLLEGREIGTEAGLVGAYYQTDSRSTYILNSPLKSRAPPMV